MTYTFSGSNLQFLTAPPSFTMHGSGATETWTETVTLNANGTVPNSDTTPSLPAGMDYQFQAVYTGDNNYKSSTSPNEPLTITSGPSATATTIKDSLGGSVTAVLGEAVFDTAIVTASPFTPTGTVTYTFSGSNLQFLTAPPSFTLHGSGATETWTETVTLNANGTVPNSDTTPFLPAGSYQFQAVYSGDINYPGGSTSPVEPLTVSQGTSSSATVIKDATNTAITNPVAIGTTVHDTATVNGTPNAFTPTGTVTYEFFTTIDGTGSHVDQMVTLSGGVVPNSNPHGPLGAGSYSFIAIYSGDGNYTGSTSAVEPLTVNKASPNLITTPGPTITLSPPNTPHMNDAAALSNGFNPGGTITFTLTAPASLGGGIVYTDIVTIGVNSGAVTGNGTYLTASMGNNPGGYVPIAPGVYQWAASYSGDVNNNPASDQGEGESQTVISVSDLSIKKTDNVGGTFDSGTNNTTGGAQFAGKTIVYTIVVSNAGPSIAVDQTVTDMLSTVVGLTGDSWTAVASNGSSVTTPSGTGDISDNVTILPLGTVTFTVTANIVALNAPSTIANTASVTLPPGDNTPGNNTSTDTVNVLSVVPSIGTDLSKIGDPEFAVTSVNNSSAVPIFLRSLTDPLLGNLLLAPNATLHVTSITLRINGALVPKNGAGGYTPGLTLPAGETLQVTVTRIVQLTDPNPTVSTTTYGFSANQNGTGATTTAAPSWTVNLFSPHILIGLSVDKTSATVGTTLTYTVTVTNNSSFNSPNLVFNVQTGNLTKLSTLVTGLNTFHISLLEHVAGAGIPAGDYVVAKTATTVTLHAAATATGPSSIAFGFSSTVALPAGFVFPSWLTNPAGLPPGYSNSFTYTHVVKSTDPNPLVNTVSMEFYVHNTEAHPVPFPNRIIGSAKASTGVSLSKTIFF